MDLREQSSLTKERRNWVNSMKRLDQLFFIAFSYVILFKNFNIVSVFINQENTQTFGNVVIRMFDPVTVQVSIDSSNIQHQKLVLKLVHPKVM